MIITYPLNTHTVSLLTNYIYPIYSTHIHSNTLHNKHVREPSMAASEKKKMLPPMADPSSENKVENPDFLKMFLKYHGNNDDDVELLFNINFKNLRLLEGDKFQHLDMGLPSQFVDGNEHLGILGSAVDGVICLYDVNNQKNIIFWNPANGQKRVLPTNYAEDLGSTDDCIPNICVHGFGYDCVNRHFKVIQYVIYDNVPSGGDEDDDDDETNSFWQLYSLSTNKWTKLDIIGHHIPFLQDYPNGLEVYLDGFCYWLGRLEASGQHYLVSFNLTSSNFSISDAPVDKDVYESSLKLVVLNGSVAMITQHDDPMSFSISILGQIGVQESWTKLFNVASLPSFKDPISAGKKVVIFFKGDENNGRVACFDLTTRVIEKEIDFEEEVDIQQIVFYKKSDKLLSMKRKKTSRH